MTDIVVERGFASRERVEEAILAARSAGLTPEQLLVDQGTITPEQRSRAVAERLGLEFLDLSAYPVDMTAVSLLPADVAKRNELVPIARHDERTLVVAMADPANVVAIDDVEIQTGMNVRTAVATREDILAVIAQMTRLDSAVTEVVDETQEQPVELTDLQEAATETPIVKLVNSLLGQAVSQGASDIHFDQALRTCACACASTACCRRSRGCRPGWFRASSPGSRSCASSTSPSGGSPRTDAWA